MHLLKHPVWPSGWNSSWGYLHVCLKRFSRKYWIVWKCCGHIFKKKSYGLDLLTNSKHVMTHSPWTLYISKTWNIFKQVYAYVWNPFCQCGAHFSEGLRVKGDTWEVFSASLFHGQTWLTKFCQYHLCSAKMPSFQHTKAEFQ